MSTRNLLINPCWSAEDLGHALPDRPHAVSVALPRWQDVIDYEEKKAVCINALSTIYPRFGLHPLVSEISRKALGKHYGEKYTAWPYPNTATAEEARKYCRRKASKGQTNIKEVLGLKCLITNEIASPAAKEFWQHTGLGASSREAAIALGKEITPSSQAGEYARATLRKRIAKIYSCPEEFVQVHPSGMAALTTALKIISGLRPNRPVLQLGFPYVDVLKLPQVVFQGSDLLLSTELEDLSSELDKRKPAAIILEVPSNPMLQCVDLKTISKLAHERNIPVIADDTIGSALNIDLLPYTDLIFTSLTKSFAGRGDILAGSLVISPQSFLQEIFKRELNKSALSSLSDADAIELEITSRDVTKRIQKLNKACLFIRNKLENHPCIARVLHPAKCPNFEALRRPGAGYGCLLSFELKEGVLQAKKFYDALEVCKGPSLGTNFTLVCPYVLLAHYNELDWAKSCGVPEHLIRVSVGLENPEELWNRFQKALEKSRQN